MDESGELFKLSLLCGDVGLRTAFVKGRFGDLKQCCLWIPRCLRWLILLWLKLLYHLKLLLVLASSD